MNSHLPPTDAPWGRRLLTLLFIGLLVALPVGWVSSQYLGNQVSSTLSYNVQDGWCEAGVYAGVGPGPHCFGDYSQSALISEHDFQIGTRDFTQQQPYLSNPGDAYNSLYPPISQLPHVASDLLRLGGVSPSGSFYLYLAFLLAAVLIPGIWVAWCWRGTAVALAPLLVIGLAALPAIVAVDRGNSAGFVVPFLMVFAVFLGREPKLMAPAAVVGAAFVRPQFILIALGLVAIGRIRHALGAVGVFAAATIASFALMPAGFGPSLHSWAGNITAFRGGFGDLTFSTPANISVARALVSTGSWVANWPGPIGRLGQHMAEFVFNHPLVPSVVLFLIAAVVLFLGRRTLPRSVAITVPLVIAATFSAVVPAYYLTFALVIAACILGPRFVRGPAGGMLDEQVPSDTPWFWGWPLIIVTMLSIAPLPFVRDTDPASPVQRNSIVLEQIGKLWLALVVLALVWIAVRTWRRRHEHSQA